mmetsp:Transcript_113183/g.320351  ORF Transcript_113183/g.320351 Transcript_113183/m.320351 type:complete len:470 (-) Transcript_113183:39-1448(-)
MEALPGDGDSDTDSCDHFMARAIAPILQHGGYSVFETDWRDSSAITGLQRCQAAFVADHHALYAWIYPSITRWQWFRALSCGGLRSYIRAGVVVLRAVHEATGSVVGYISCSPVVPREHVDASRHSATEADEEEATSAAAASLASRPAPTTATDLSEETEPYGKVNQMAVLPRHRGRGVGRMLFDALLQYLAAVAPRVADDLRIVAVELNERALGWYWRLGFIVDQIYADRFSDGPFSHRVVYLKLRRRTSASLGSSTEAVTTNRVFGEELLGEKVVLLPEPAPGFLMDEDSVAAPKSPETKKLTAMDWAPLSAKPLLVKSYDDVSGCHGLEDGRSIDLSKAFALGRCRFGRPFHAIFGRSVRLSQWSGDDATSSVASTKEDPKIIEVASGSESNEEGECVVVQDAVAQSPSVAKRSHFGHCGAPSVRRSDSTQRADLGSGCKRIRVRVKGGRIFGVHQRSEPVAHCSA